MWTVALRKRKVVRGAMAPPMLTSFPELVAQEDKRRTLRMKHDRAALDALQTKTKVSQPKHDVTAPSLSLTLALSRVLSFGRVLACRYCFF